MQGARANYLRKVEKCKKFTNCRLAYLLSIHIWWIPPDDLDGKKIDAKSQKSVNLFAYMKKK